MGAVKVPTATYYSQHSLIRPVTADFEVLDVWALPVEGSRADAAEAQRLVSEFDPVTHGPWVVRLLFAVRLRLGALLGWDKPEERPIPGCKEVSVRERLPPDLRRTADELTVNATVQSVAGGFMPLYRTEEEWAAEISNATVHGVLHLTWAPTGEPDRLRGQMAVLVKPRGWRVRAYLALIEPFRQLIVYTAMMRQLSKTWSGRDGGPGRIHPLPGGE